MESEKTIKQRTHRMSLGLLRQVEAEADKSGNSVSNEMNSLIRDGLRLREAKIVIQVQG